MRPIKNKDALWRHRLPKETLPIPLEDEMRRSYPIGAMSVIVVVRCRCT